MVSTRGAHTVGGGDHGSSVRRSLSQRATDPVTKVPRAGAGAEQCGDSGGPSSETAKVIEVAADVA